MRTLTTRLKNISILYVLTKLITFILLVTICLLFTYSPIRDRLNLKKMSQEYSEQLLSLKVDISNLEKEKLELEQQKEMLFSEFEIIKNEAKIINDNFINNLDKYVELRDKYSYAIYYNNKNADFGLNELIYLDEICNEYEVPISIMLAIFEKESRFCSTAKNSSSTATGYGQLISSTAKFIYEKFLNLGTYDISNHRTIACDKKLNILMATRLIKYNIDTYGSKWKAVERYYGSTSKSANYSYAKDINNKMNRYGDSLK